ncbi:MAG TPA: zinc-dependent peptidase [Gammaproteobacteria bacterium]|nr:zinc-dependent peptidase [Gammaproteobacteria bacterium]
MLRALARYRRARIIHHQRIPFALWRQVCRRVELLRRLTPPERARLRLLTTLFLREKHINGAQGLELNREMEVIIAAQACVLILNLGLELFDGWVEVVVYPDAFHVPQDVPDDIGLVEEGMEVRDGESWLQGPVILSWASIEQELANGEAGRNLILHEFSHKLDMLNGRANGFPPLHPEMDLPRWTRVLSQAFDRLQDPGCCHEAACIDDYAATDPAEFFAVASEYFFMSPDVLHHYYAELYEQLSAYYRQDPLTRQAASTAIT